MALLLLPSFSDCRKCECVQVYRCAPANEVKRARKVKEKGKASLAKSGRKLGKCKLASCTAMNFDAARVLSVHFWPSLLLCAQPSEGAKCWPLFPLSLISFPLSCQFRAYEWACITFAARARLCGSGRRSRRDSHSALRGHTHNTLFICHCSETKLEDRERQGYIIICFTSSASAAIGATSRLSIPYCQLNHIDWPIWHCHSCDSFAHSVPSLSFSLDNPKSESCS